MATPKKRKPAKKAAAKKPRGRPSKFTPALAKEICARLSVAEPLTVICQSEHMPHDDTVRLWQKSRPEFAQDIARAREAGWDKLAKECLEIADATENDTVMVGAGEHEREAANTEWISRSKLRVETRLKLLAKWDPKRYGEKIQQEHSGEIGIRTLAAKMRERAQKA